MSFSKLFSLFSNFLPFGIYVMVLSLTYEFSWILRGILIFVVTIQVIFAFFLKIVFKKESEKYSNSEKRYKIVRITRDRQSSLNFIVTNVFPLIALDLKNIATIIFTVIILIMITILFLKNNLYLYNPILEICGYKIYNYSSSYASRQYQGVILLDYFFEYYICLKKFLHIDYLFLLH